MICSQLSKEEDCRRERTENKMEKKTVSMCPTADYCRGWNDAVEESRNQWQSVVKDYLPNLPEVEEEVLIYCESANGGDGIITKAFYEDGEMTLDKSSYIWEDRFTNVEYDEKKDDWVIDKGWWESCNFSAGEHIGMKVTHWMPLPLSPKKGIKE